ncbi:hypothetical protein [Candidatus Nitrosocosmicus hydrocola]|uniref:hypothetical protein n=1 Tax=Candidatus Nitrosocosmicus hydrocola TaxID=1826872 RepID=UPI000B219BFD|nr:hypothetical protein [Candidatus Nitrosocosmicus hydrocola]
MVKKFGVFFAVLLVVLLLSNTNYNANNQVFAQNTSGIIEPNVTQTPTPTPTPTDTPIPTPTQSPSTNITKLTGGVKINSPDKGDLVPLNSNKSLVINGVSKDNASSDCDVTIIVNNVKPYQNVQPTGIQGNNDYSTWQYTLASNYTSINEGNNKITSKIYCAGGAGGGSLGAGTALSPQPSQAYYSVNITASNFTQAQLTNYELMLESASNSTNGNSTLVLNGIQPVAQIQQFNQDTGSGPVCCKTTSALTTQSSDSGTGSSSSSNNDDDDSDDSSSSNNDDDDSDDSSSSNNDDDDSDDSSSSRNDDDDSDDSSSSRNDDDDDDNDSSSSSSRNDDDDDDNDSSSSSSRNDDDDDDNDSSSSSSSSRNDDDDDDNDSSSSSSSSSSRNDDDDSFDFSSRMNDFDFGFDFDTEGGDSDSSWSGDSGDDSGVDSILDDVEDTMRSAGLDFSFS